MFFVPNQRDLGGASAPLGGASCAPGAARRRGPLADGPSRGARPVGVALTRRARPPASFPAGPRTVPRECRHSKQLPSFFPLFERRCCTPSPPVIRDAPDPTLAALDRHPGDRPQVADRGRHSSLLSRACSTEGSCGSPSSRDRRRHHVLGRPRQRGAAPRRFVRRLDRRRAHPRLLRASHSVFTLRAADKVSSRPPPSQSPPQRCTGRSFSPRRRSERPTLPRAAIKQARCLPSPHFPSTPTLPLPGTRRCDSRAHSPHPSPADQARPDESPSRRSSGSHREPPCELMGAQKVAHPPVACRPSPSLCRRRDHEPSAQFRLPPPPPCLQAVPRWREEARRAIGDVLASSCPPKRSHRPVAPPSAPPRAATVRPPGLAYTG